MAVAKNKTVATKVAAAGFLAKLKPDSKRKDAQALAAALEKITGEKAVMWGSIVGFGQHHYKYDSGREGDWMDVGFAPRAAALTLYVHGGFAERDALVAKLGKVKVSGSCIHVKALADVDLKALGALVKKSQAWLRKTYPGNSK